MKNIKPHIWVEVINPNSQFCIAQLSSTITNIQKNTPNPVMARKGERELERGKKRTHYQRHDRLRSDGFGFTFTISRWVLGLLAGVEFRNCDVK